MAVPKSKISKSAKKMRRSHIKLKTPSVHNCKNCGNATLPHRVCSHCGFYDGKVVANLNQ